MTSIKPSIILAVPRESPVFDKLWSEKASAEAEKLGLKIDFIDRTPESPAEWNRAVSHYDALISSWGTPCIDKDILNNNDRLKIVTHAAGSVADLVSRELYAKGIKVCSANPLMGFAVAEWCVGMTIAGNNNFPRYANCGGLKSVVFDFSGCSCRSIRDSKIGVWGYGTIARHYVNMLKAFSPRQIKVCSKHMTEDAAENEGITLASLENIFSSCDVIVLLAGMTVDNIECIDKKLLDMIKEGSVLINAGRAKLVNEKALKDALKTERFNACLDVFHQEPLPADDELQSMKNVIITPHIAGFSSIKSYIPAMLGEIHRFFTGGRLQYEVMQARTKTMSSSRADGL